MPWYFFAILSAILVAFASIWEKRVLQKTHAMEFSAALSLAAAVLALPLLFLADLSNITTESLIWLYIISLPGTIAFLFIAKAARHMEISIVSPLLVTAPAFTAIMAYFFLGEALNTQQTIGITILVLGAYTLSLEKDFNFWHPLAHTFKSKYVFYVLGALILYGLAATGDRHILYNLGVSPLAYIGIVHLFIAINFTVLMTIFHDGIRGQYNAIRNIGLATLGIAALMVTYRLAEVIAVSGAFVALAIAIKRTSALFTTIIGGQLFHEANILRKTFAVLVMLGGAALLIV